MGDRAKEYFQALQRAIDEDEEDDIIDISSQLLNFIPKDEETRKCRAIAYMKTGQFAEAAADLDLLKNVDFEKCFCMYGQGKYSECLAYMRNLPAQALKDDRWDRLLEQVYFRLDDAHNMKELYAKQDFNDLGDEDEKEERLVNISAGLALIGDAERALSLLDVKNARIEQIYNTATICVDAKMYEKATELIEIGFSKAKPASTYAQLLNLLKTQIKAATQPDVATEEYLAVVENEEANTYVRTVAASNYAALTLDSNIHVAKKKMSFFDDNEKYGTYRKSEIEPFLINRFLILHKIGQPNKVKALIEFAKKLPSFNKLTLEAFNRTIDPLSSASTEFSPLFAAQALINQNCFREAAEQLASSSFIKHPRTIAVVTDLYATAYKVELANGNADEAKKNLDAAVAFLAKTPCTLPAFYEFAAMFCFNNGYYKEAASWSEKMAKSTRATALQAVTLSETDIEMAERYASRLSVKSVDGAELDALEAAPLPKVDIVETQKTYSIIFGTGKRKKKTPLSEMSPEKLKKLKEKKRRRRRLQKPPNYDPDKKMDPERWIPMSKRAAGKRKKKQQQQKQAKQQQYKQQKKKGGKRK